MGFTGKRALVTGAASGIGKATALAFARGGADLVICDLNEQALEAAAEEARSMGRDVFLRKVDVSDRAAMKAFAEEVNTSLGGIDILVNNAGVAHGGMFVDAPLEDWDWILSINLMGVIHGCHFFLPKMIDRGGGGHVVNISSAAGFMGLAGMSLYCTTKFAVFGFSESLREELRPHRIGVTVVCPGFIDTRIAKGGRMVGKHATPEMKAKAEALLRNRNFSPDRVAERILNAVERDVHVLPVTPEAWGLYFLKRLSPGATTLLRRTAANRVREGKL